MQSQLTIDWTAPAQAHSRTSCDAAAAIQPRAGTIRAAVLAYITTHGPVTDEQIAEGLALNPSCARPRRIELERVGAIEPCGEGVTRAGRKAVRWRAV